MGLHPFKLLLAAGVVALATTLHAGNPYRIMVTGDSISVGYTDLPNWNEPFEFGFRSGLYTRLTNSGMAVQFVGNSGEPWNGGSAGTYAVPTNTPTLDLRPLGQDHCEGYGGKKTAFILSNMPAWLAADSPDIILLMIGINDIHNDVAEPVTTEQTLSNIVYTVTTTAPAVRLVVAQITPYWTNCPGIVKYNTYIRNVLVPYFAGQGKYVTTVDQYTNMLVAGTTNIDPSLFSNGVNHPNNMVYDRMAETWFQGIQSLSLPPPQPPPTSALLKWSGAANANWNTSDPNWKFRTNGDVTAYVDGSPGDDVLFDDTLSGNPAILLNSTVSPVAVTFSNNAAYAISGSGQIVGATGLIKNGTGTVTLNTSNAFTGNLTVNLGAVILNGANGFGNTTLISNAVVRAGKTGALGRGTVSVAGAQLDTCRIELTGGVVVTNALSLRSRNFPLGFSAHVLNVSGTNTLNPPGDLVLATGGNVLTLQSDSGLLVFSKGMTTSASAPRYFALQGTGKGEVQGGISANGALVKLGTGTWTMSGISPMNGPTIISNGLLVVNGSFTSVVNGVTNAGGTLAGNGIIAGPVRIQTGSTLAPGRLTINNALTLQGTAVMEIARNGSALTNDLVTGISTIAYGGTLIVTNIGGSALHVGDSFQLFAATNYSGAFTSIVYPDGYTFTDTLASDGKITVLTSPVTAAPTLGYASSGGNLVFNWSGSGFKLQSQTNTLAVGLKTNWSDVPGGTASGASVPVTTGNPAVFFRLISTP